MLVVNDRNVVESQTVTLGSSENGMQIIEKGLAADDWVAISGL